MQNSPHVIAKIMLQRGAIWQSVNTLMLATERYQIYHSWFRASLSYRSPSNEKVNYDMKVSENPKNHYPVTKKNSQKLATLREPYSVVTIFQSFIFG